MAKKRWKMRPYGRVKKNTGCMCCNSIESVRSQERLKGKSEIREGVRSWISSLKGNSRA